MKNCMFALSLFPSATPLVNSGPGSQGLSEVQAYEVGFLLSINGAGKVPTSVPKEMTWNSQCLDSPTPLLRVNSSL
jgi:hypothetical protein